MFDNKNELEARQEILGIVDEYCKKYHNQKQYKEGDRVVGGLDTTDRIMRDTFWVGVYPGMTDEMIDYMAKTIKEAVNQ